MVTRALAAEIRHDASRFLELLYARSGEATFGRLQTVTCEAEQNIDVKLEFDREGSSPYRVGIEGAYLAKGYTDGWAIGPKTEKVGVEGLDELARITAEVFDRWYAAETAR